MSEGTAETDDVEPGAGADDVEPDAGADRAVADSRRDVVVPLEIYKVVTVFSTLLAVGAVVVGFVLLDWGTNRAQAEASEVNLGLVAVGILAIGLGAATYAFSTRFRTEGMTVEDGGTDADAEDDSRLESRKGNNKAEGAGRSGNG